MPLRYNFLKTSHKNFAESFFPARPQRLWAKTRKFAKLQMGAVKKIGLPIALNRVYIKWLEKESMLGNANEQAVEYSGKGRMWQNPYAKPRPRLAVKMASTWYTAYPPSMITRPNASILETLGDEELWKAFEQIGIKGLHTGPLKRAGGLNGWDETSSIDGHFDRISMQIDPLFGTEQEFRAMCEVAARHKGIIIDDIVPGHTGKGADFRLAEMSHKDYPGIYHMVEIDPEDWHLLPEVPKGKDSTNISPETETQLKELGYIIGKLQRVIFYEPGVKETNWSATRAIKGTDGLKRRWVYLHYFKAGLPSINWLDPSCAGMKLVIGDSLHSIGTLGSKGLRLDANGFLGIEKDSMGGPAWSQGHPLSVVANEMVAGMVRKVGGFTFQELNLSLDDLKAMSDSGADLSYDFINRPALHHALVAADTEFLRLMMRSAIAYDIDPAVLIHALQNHDDLTYELVHFWTVHKDDEYQYQGKKFKGSELRLQIRHELAQGIAGKHAPYNLLFTENGIACTTASSIAAALGYTDVRALTAADIERIKQVHLLLAMFNALQPGVFALSGWDLSGSLTLAPQAVQDLLEEGDTRWINRGAYDLIGSDPGAQQSASGMPRAVNLYGTLPEQLADPSSFASRLRVILAMRERYGIAVSHQVDIPDVSHKSMLVVVHKLAEEHGMQVTVLNFSNEAVKGIVTSEFLTSGATVTDMFSSQDIATVDELHSFTISLGGYEGTSLLIHAD